MRSSRANALPIGILILLAGGLAVLATLQYRWIGQVSEAERVRMRASLDLSGRQFGGDLAAEIEEIFGTFAGPGGEDAGRRYDEWLENAAHPRLIDAVYLVWPNAVRSLDLHTGWLVDATLPETLSARPGGPPFDTEALALILRPRLGQEQRPGPGPRPRPGPGLGSGPQPRPEPGSEPELGGPDGPLRLGGPPAGERFEPARIIMLNRHELTNVVIPDLLKRHFDDGYDIALTTPASTLFRSNPSWPDGKNPPDVDVPLPALRLPEGRPRRFRGDPDAHPPGLHLLVRRHDGGVDASVASARHRNLAVSAGIFVILAATIGVLLYLLRRADRLREQQTEFVAAISHELNTPVTALRSAGENLKDGIITDRARLARYGETIVKESARLADMIDQVLEFAGMRARRARARNEPIDLAAVVEDAASQCRLLGDAVRIETNVEPDLPQPPGDPVALTRAVQNLIANAVRHGGSGGWVGVRASKNGSKVTIVVEDRGPGVDGREAAHLFEPFYRGRRSNAVRGAGLGLTIVQQIVAAHGGTITIDRRRRQGAAFIITLPVERPGERNV